MESSAQLKKDLEPENNVEENIDDALNKKAHMYNALNLISKAIIGIASVILLIRVVTSLDFRMNMNPLVILVFIIPAISSLVAAYKGIKKYKNTSQLNETEERYTLKEYKKLKWKFFFSIPLNLIGLGLLILFASIFSTSFGPATDIANIQFSGDEYKVGEIIKASFNGTPSWETKEIDSKQSKVSVKGYSPVYKENIQIHFDYEVEDLNDDQYEYAVGLTGFDLLDSNESYTDKMTISYLWDQLHNACDLKKNNKDIVSVDTPQINHSNKEVDNVNLGESNQTNQNDIATLNNIEDINDLYSEDGNTIELIDTHIKYEDFEEYMFDNYPFEVFMLVSMNEEGYINDDEFGIVMTEALFEYLDYLYEENSITEADKSMIEMIKAMYLEEYGDYLDNLQLKLDAYME